MKKGFDLKKYVDAQSKNIQERVKQFGNKLYLEFGGKLFDDYHASRVLPGFEADSKLKMLLSLKDDVEIIIAVNANDLKNKRIRKDLNITYEAEIFRLIDGFSEADIFVGSIVITHYIDCEQVRRFRKRLENDGIPSYAFNTIDNYPSDVDHVLSDKGFGSNPFVATSKPIVVVTAPGPGSGKMAVCLSQVYNGAKRGIKSGYAKFETFPVWNLPLDHPINYAYEAATVDLNDRNVIDTFHQNKYGVNAVNYNRDMATFPVLKEMFERIYGESPYFSPTDMGVNMIKQGIINDEVVRDACKQEIIRRYLDALIYQRQGMISQADVDKYINIMNKVGVKLEDRKVVAAAKEKEKLTGVPCAAIELSNGKIVTGKTSALFSCAASLLINALKVLGNIDDSIDLLPSNILNPIQELKINKLKNHHPRIHADEILIALAISAANNPLAKLAMDNLEKLKGCEMHSTIILKPIDLTVYNKLCVHVTTDPYFMVQKLHPRKK